MEKEITKQRLRLTTPEPAEPQRRTSFPSLSSGFEDCRILAPVYQDFTSFSKEATNENHPESLPLKLSILNQVPNRYQVRINLSIQTQTIIVSIISIISRISRISKAHSQLFHILINLLTVAASIYAKRIEWHARVKCSQILYIFRNFSRDLCIWSYFLVWFIRTQKLKASTTI